MDLMSHITLVLLPVAASIIGFIIKNLFNQVHDIDLRLRNVLSDRDVRLLISDKIDPIKEDIQEIKQKIDQLLRLNNHDNHWMDSTKKR